DEIAGGEKSDAMLSPRNRRQKHHQRPGRSQLPKQPGLITRPNQSPRPPHENRYQDEQKGDHDPTSKLGRKIKKIDWGWIDFAIKILCRLLLSHEITHKHRTQRHVFVPEVQVSLKP